MKKTGETDMSVRDAATHLARELGDSVDRWVAWLKTDRRPRGPSRIAVQRGLGRPRYLVRDVERFAKNERARRLKNDLATSSRVRDIIDAYGLDKAESGYGRVLDAEVMPCTTDPDAPAPEPFVRLIIADTPPRAYRLGPTQARALAGELTGAADAAERDVAHLLKIWAED